MSTGLERRTLLSWMVEPAQRAPVRSPNAEAEVFRATGAGTTTTTVCTALTGATDASYVGQVIECVGGTAANIGLAALILEFNAATDTLTHTAFPASTTTLDEFVTYDPPDPYVNITTSGASAISSSRIEADDYWIGDTLVRRSAGAEQGEMRAVTDFTAGSDNFAHAAFTTSPIMGDLFLLRRFPKLWGPPTISYKREELKKEEQRGDFSQSQFVPGCRTWTAETTLPVKGPGTAAGDTIDAVYVPEIHRLLAAVHDVARAQGDAVVASVGIANSTTAFCIPTGDVGHFPVGSLIMDHRGRANCVTATNLDGANPDVITHAPGFAIASVPTDIIYGGVGYYPKLTGHLTHTLDVFLGDKLNWIGYGGIPKIQIVDIKRNSVPKLKISWQGNYWIETEYVMPSTTYFAPVFDTVKPIHAADVNVFLGAARLLAEEVTIDLGIQIAQEDAVSLPDAIYGNRIIGYDATIHVAAKLDNAAPANTYAEIQRYMGGQTFSLFIQHGKVPGFTFAAYANNCCWEGPTHGVADGLRKLSFTARVLASGLTGLGDLVVGTV